MAAEQNVLVLDPRVIDRLRAMDPTGARGILKRAIGMWETAAAEELASMTRALEHGDRRVLAASAHRLRGSTSMLGGVALGDALARLERASASEPTDVLADLCARVLGAHQLFFGCLTSAEGARS